MRLIAASRKGMGNLFPQRVGVAVRFYLAPTGAASPRHINALYSPFFGASIPETGRCS